jgi:putative aminopeptidase FrvX
MIKEKLDRLKEVLSVPTHSGDESRMIKYLVEVLEGKGYDYEVDSMGNIFVTKGETEFFPLFIAHTDTVHRVNENLTIKEYIHNGTRHENKVALTGYDSTTNEPSGCGGDDKCGVYLALEMLDTLENVKAAFFISEEIGCVGSKAAVQTNPEFFKNVGYAIQYDSPEGDSLSSTLMGKYLFESSPEFTELVGGTIKEAGITKWATHPYTDIWPLLEKFDFCCLNLAAGYYRYHTKNEYVIVDDVQNGYDLGMKLYGILGENKYERPDKKRSWYDDYKSSRSETKTVLVESSPITKEDDDKMESLNGKSINDWTDEDWDFYDDYCDRKYGDDDIIFY